MTGEDLNVALRIDHEDWQIGVQEIDALCERAVRAGWVAGRDALPKSDPLSGTLSSPVEISVVLSDDQNVRDLNREHRGKDAPTNVLSFPGDVENPFPGAEVLVGDVILAWETIAAEAAAAHKPVTDHVTHLLIHGVLHLLGYDHVREDDATVMERIEVDCLAGLGIEDPYAEDPLFSMAPEQS